MNVSTVLYRGTTRPYIVYDYFKQEISDKCPDFRVILVVRAAAGGGGRSAKSGGISCIARRIRDYPINPCK
jgi:hypothetical protein